MTPDTPLYFAAHNSNPEIFDFLVKHTKYSAAASFRRALQAHNFPVIEFLLTVGKILIMMIMITIVYCIG